MTRDEQQTWPLGTLLCFLLAALVWSNLGTSGDSTEGAPAAAAPPGWGALDLAHADEEDALFLDVALFAIDRASLDEQTVVAGRVTIQREKDLALFLHSSPVVDTNRSVEERRRSGFIGQFGGHRPVRLSRARGPRRSLNGRTTIGPDGVGHHIDLGLWVAHRAVRGETHLVELELKGHYTRVEANGWGGGSVSGARDLVAIRPGFPHVVKVGSEELFLVMVLREDAQDGGEASETSTWLELARETALLPAADLDEVHALEDLAVQSHNEWGNRFTLVVPDPALEAALLSVHLADFDLARRAKEALPDHVEDLERVVAAAEPRFVGRFPRTPHPGDKQWRAERWAALCLVDAIDFDDLPGGGPREDRWSEPRAWLAQHIDPVRLHGITVSPQAAQASANREMRERYANHRVAHAQAALQLAVISDTLEVQASWARLREHYAAEVGWMSAMALASPTKLLLLGFSGWALAAILVFAVKRGRPYRARRSGLGVLLLVLGTALTVLQAPQGLLVLPFWIAYARSWSGSEHARWWHRIALTLALGGMLSQGLHWIRVAPSINELEPLARVAQTLCYLTLGFHFSVRRTGWRFDLWGWTVASLVAGDIYSLFAEPQVMFGWAAIVGFVLFMLTSRGDQKVQDEQDQPAADSPSAVPDETVANP